MRPIDEIRRQVAPLRVQADFVPSGDQPTAIAELERRIRGGEQDVVLLGATGTGKTATVAWLAERFEGLENDPQTHALIASAIAAEQVLDLVDRGVRDFHFYTMNRPDLVFAVCRLIGVREEHVDAAA